MTVTVPKRAMRLMKFQLRLGSHVEPDRAAPKLKDGSMPQRRFYADWRNQKYPIVASPLDLVKRCGSEKFTRVHDDAKADEGELLNFQFEDIIDEYDDAGPITGPYTVLEAPHHIGEQGDQPVGAPVGNDTLDSMTVDELRKEAADNEINLGGAKTKADIIKVLNQNGIKG